VCTGSDTDVEFAHRQYAMVGGVPDVIEYELRCRTCGAFSMYAGEVADPGNPF